MARNGSSSSKISVWWDIENCHVPRNVDPHYIAQNLRLALHHVNLNGPITIDVFGDTKNLDHKTLEALSSTGITINHIPSGNKDAADKAILVAMLFWALDNSPPAHFLLISGDGDFANALHRLRLKGYDILLARPDQPVKPALLGAATSIWYWTNVARGQIPVPEEVKKIYEESSGRFSSNKMGNDDFVKVDPYKQKSLPKVFSQQNTLLSGAFGVSTDEGVQSLNRRTAPLQESERSGKCHRDISPTVASHPWVSDRGAKTSMSYEDMRRFDEDAAKLEPSSKQPWNLGHQPVRSGDEKTDLSKQSCDKHGIPFVSSNKIADHTKAPPATFSPSPTVAEHLPSLSQDAYNSDVLKVMNSFERLKLDGLLPTQAYLQDCLCYWDKQHGKVNLKQVLDQAVHLQHIRKVPVGEGAFLPCNTELWNCFNIGDMMYAFSDELWKEFHQFLCCSKNWQFFVHSQSMYEAAQRLKSNGHSGIRDLAVGEIILFLDQAIRKRNWLSLEITPTFVLSIKSQVVMEQNLSEGIRSSTSRVPKDDKGFMANVTCTKGSAKVYHTPTKLLILEKLRTWLMEISQTRPDYDVSLVPKDFQQATGIHLDIQKLGFEKLQGLIEEFDDVVTIKVARKGLKILCPAAKVNRLKAPPTFETFQDEQQRAKPAVTTNFATTFQDKEKQGCSQLPAAFTSQRLGVSAPDGVSPNLPPKSVALDHHTSASKDVAQHAHHSPSVTTTSWNAGAFQNSSEKAQHAHHPPSVTTTSWNAGAFQNSSEKAAARNHPTLKKLRSWLLQLPSLKHGYDLSLIKKDFHEATGIVLDPPSLGYPKVKDILNVFPKDFHLESPRKGLYLLFGNKKSMSAMKSNPGSNTHHLAKQSSGHLVGEEVTCKPAQISAANNSSSMQWKELHQTIGVNYGENSEVNKSAVGATTFVLVATNDVQH